VNAPTNELDFYDGDNFIFFGRASYDPHKTIAERSVTTLQWEFVQPERMRPHYSRKLTIAGYAPQTSDEVFDLGSLKIIDTDCGRGRWLTAFDVVHRPGRLARQSSTTRARRQGDRSLHALLLTTLTRSTPA
jgi:serine/threonine protein phosphatase 1